MKFELQLNEMKSKQQQGITPKGAFKPIMRSSFQSKRLLKGIKVEEAICDTWETHCAE